MKILTKIKLIKWHGFDDTTIKANGSILIIGESGSGKSTLMDALYFVLSGGEEKFNKAANEDAARTLETYMRGKIGIEGKEFLRNNSNLVSHIALEFYDQERKKSFVLGCVLEIQDGNKKIQKSFYHIKNRGINDDDYYCDKREKIKNYKAMSISLGNEINALEGSRSDIRKALYSVLSIESKKYYELLPKAIAFRPISNINKFVYEFLMPENNVDITNIQQNIHSYNEIQKRIDEDKKKKEALEAIVQNGDNFKEKSLERKLLETYKIKREIDSLTLNNNKIKNSIEKVKIEFDEAQKTQKNCEERLEDINKNIWLIENNEQYRAIDNLEKTINNLNNQLKIAKDREKLLNEAILSEDNLLNQLGIKSNLQVFIKNHDFVNFKLALNNSHRNYVQKRKQLTEQNAINKSKMSQIHDEMSQCKQDLENLKNGFPVYSKEVKELISVIQSGVYQETKKSIYVKPFCELIDIKNGEEEWRDAIEGYLNTRRFDLFVDAKYYDLSLSLYEKFKKEKKISGVGLVNVAKIKDEGVLNNSLATKILICDENDIDALKYSNYILGKIICVESEKELKNYESAITKTVMVYQNKAARQTKFKIYETPYIGLNSITIRIKNLQSKMVELTKQYKELKDNIDKQDLIINSTENTKYFELNSFEDAWNTYLNIKNQISSYSNEYNELESNAEKLMIEKRSIEKNKTNLMGEIDRQKRVIIEKSKEESNFESLLKDNQEKIKQLETEYEEKLHDDEISSNFDTFVTVNKFSQNEITQRHMALCKVIDDIKTSLVKKMDRYIQQYEFDATSDIGSLSDFYHEYNVVVKRNLEKYQKQLEKVKENAVQTFQNEYISKIRKNIKTEKANIEKLNKVLSDKPFGFDKEIYKFEITASKDPKFGDYYNIFMSNEDYLTNNFDLFTEQLSDIHFQLMQDLFLRLTNENESNSQQERIIREYTDYRNFMNYDIIITNKDGDKTRFSKISREKSGGETQTPFYVIVAASFDQIVHAGYRKNSSGCIVMFDEAFNNMDESRINSMMEYFKQLDIQPIIGVPSNRAQFIAKHVNTRIFLIKKKHRFISRFLIGDK